MGKRISLVPQYLKKFQCTGTACQDNCCSAGWNVFVDKDTYKKYSKLRDEELSPLLSECVALNRAANSSDTRYATIAMVHNRCPLLGEDGLCRVQRKLGGDFLSNVCMEYPRITNIVNDVFERSTVMSCPEAARVALLNPDGIEFDEDLDDSPIRNEIYNQIDTNAQQNQNKPEKYFWDLREFTITLLQNREYTLADRLILLGLFYQAAQKLTDDGKLDDIPDLIALYTLYAHQGTLRASLVAIPANTDIQMRLLKEIVDNRFAQGVSSTVFMLCYNDFLKGLQLDADGALDESTGRLYTQAYSLYFEPFQEEYGYILENYLVNYVFSNLFPFYLKMSLLENYSMMVLLYAFIKMMMIGMGAANKGLSIEDALLLIISFTRTVEHSPQFIQQMLQLMADSGYNTMAYMAILLRN